MDIAAVLTSTIVGEPERAAADIARYFDPAYVQITDGITSDYDGFVTHIQHVRSVVADAEIVVHDVIQVGDRIADRHTVHVRKHDGSRSAFEVLLIGTAAADGRLLHVTELTRQIHGDGADADLGTATS